MPIGSKMNTHCMTINKQNPFLQKSCPTTMQTKKLLKNNGKNGQSMEVVVYQLRHVNNLPYQKV